MSDKPNHRLMIRLVQPTTHMNTFEAHLTLGAISIAVSAIGAALTVESKLAAVQEPSAVLTVLMPREQIEPLTVIFGNQESAPHEEPENGRIFAEYE